MRLRSPLVEAIGKAKVKPKALISASAVGYYGPHGDERLNEDSKPGDDFLSRLCVDWENEAKKAEPFGVRVSLLRTGVVLSVLALMLGEMADMLLTGQRAIPDAALKLGYQFKYPHLADALSALRL